MDSLDQFAKRKLERISARGLRRHLDETARAAGAAARRNGRALVSFCCNDYLGLSQHPAVKAAAIAATERYGAGAGASRLVSGNHPLYRALEARLAELKGTEAACVFGSGYLTNSGVVPCFAGADDLILADELSHACLFAGGTLGGASVRRFRHNDLDGLRLQLRAHRAAHPRCLVLTESVFSMDGDLAPLSALAALAREYDAWLLVDDAHGLGVVGQGGHADVPLQTGTLSKAVGAYGGYLCASAPVVDLVRNRARTLIYSTGLPPATVAAASAALEIIAGDAALRARPLQKARLFCAELGLEAPQSCIVPIILGDAETAVAAAKALEGAGYLVTAIRPPSVPEGTSRLRLTFSAAHSDEDVLGLARAVRPMLSTECEPDRQLQPAQ